MIKLSEAVEKISEYWVQKVSIRISVSLNKTNKRTNWQTHKKNLNDNKYHFSPCFLASLLNYGAMIQATGRYKSSNKIIVKIWIQLSYDISCFFIILLLEDKFMAQGFINLLTDSFTMCHTGIRV